MTKRTTPKIDAGLTAKIALEPLREHATVADLAQRYPIHPNQISTVKKQLPDQAVNAFESGTSDAVIDHHRRIEKLHGKIGQIIVIWIF